MLRLVTLLLQLLLSCDLLLVAYAGLVRNNYTNRCKNTGQQSTQTNKRMSKKYFGVVLFGFGRAGQIHFHNLRNSPRAEILYIVEEYPDKAQETIEEYRLKDIKIISPGYSTVALEDDRVQAVFVATPTFTHQKIVTEAVAAGKAVFCEKPIAQTLEDTRKCYAAAEKNGVLLQCGLNRRYDPSIRNVYDQLHNGNIGKLHLVKTTARDHRLTTQLSYLASSGGLFNDCAVHDLDMVCWLVGEFPSEIHVFGNANEPEIKAMNDADTAVITLKFPCGVIAVIDISRLAVYGYDQRLEVYGDGGMLESQNQRRTGVMSYSKVGIHTEKLKNNFPERYAESYVNTMDNFFNILEGKSEPDVAMETVVEVSRLSSACEESWRTGKPIKMADFKVKNNH